MRDHEGVGGVLGGVAIACEYCGEAASSECLSLGDRDQGN